MAAGCAGAGTHRRALPPWEKAQTLISLALLLFASLATFTALTACGGGFGMNAASAPTSYSITVTGTSGSIQQTTTVQLTVQ